MKIVILTVALVGLVSLAISAITPLDIDSSASITNETKIPNAETQIKHHSVRRANWDSAPMPTDQQWCNAQAKGAELYRTMWKSDLAAGSNYNPPRQSGNSVFRADNLQNMMYNTWGWADADYQYTDAQFKGIYGDGWINAMKDRGIGIEPWTDVWSYHFSHGAKGVRDEHGQPIPMNEQQYSAYGRNYPVTGAQAKFGVQDRAGAIFVSTAVSPTTAYKELYGKNINPNDLPALRSLSDLLWAGWIRGSNPHVGNPNPANLNYMFMIWIVNSETLSIMKKALASRGKTKPSVWPGDDFDTSTPEGAALLGTPNGKPMGYLVNQRKLDMGVR